MTKKESCKKDEAGEPASPPASPAPAAPIPAAPVLAEEIGGRHGPEPTRYGDWEVKGICSDF